MNKILKGGKHISIEQSDTTGRIQGMAKSSGKKLTYFIVNIYFYI